MKKYTVTSSATFGNPPKRRFQFQRRVETILKDFEVFMYAEAPQGPSRAVKGLDDYRPWVEFDLRPTKRTYPKEACHVPLKVLAKLSKLLGTPDITVTGYNMGDSCQKCGEKDTDYIGYVLARGVKFK